MRVISERARRSWPASFLLELRSRSACRSDWRPVTLGGALDALIGRMTDAMLACPFLIRGNRAGCVSRPKSRQRHDRHVASPRRRFCTADARTGAGGQDRKIMSKLRARFVTRAGASCSSISCRTSCRRYWSRPRCQSRQRSSRKPRFHSLAFGNNRRPSWGGMLDSAQRFLVNAPWMAVWPGLAIFLTVSSFNLVGGWPARCA